MTKKILIVAAHPDDEVLGCFGTVARMIEEGCEAYTLILGEGKTSRGDSRDVSARGDEIAALNNEMKLANNLIGINKVFTAGLPDNRFDSVDLLDVVKAVLTVKEEIKPDIVFTHYANDLNIDHRVTYNAVLTACRPMENETVKEIYSFEVLSSTEWNYPLTFSPDIYFDISGSIFKKKEAMALYGSEIRDFPHPRSVEGIELNARWHGMRTGLAYAEAFKTVRVIK